MSWSPELPIGQMRPWPDSVHVVRAKDDEVRRYLPERTCEFVTVIDSDPSRLHRGNICECNACGFRCALGFIMDEHFKYCPRCGAKVVSS